MVNPALKAIFLKVDNKGADLWTLFSVTVPQPCSWANCRRYYNAHLTAYGARGRIGPCMRQLVSSVCVRTAGESRAVRGAWADVAYSRRAALGQLQRADAVRPGMGRCQACDL